MSDVLSEVDETLYRVSYILTENRQFQCPVCFEVFIDENEIQEHMSNYNHYEATSVFIKSEKEETENEHLCGKPESTEGTLLEEKIQTQVIHALSNIEKLTHQIVQEEYVEESSNEAVMSHLQVELKTDDTQKTEGIKYIPGNKIIIRKVKDGASPIPIKKIKLQEYECELCKTTYPTRHLLKQHMKEHEGDSNYSCDICRKTFTFKQQLSTHQKCHTLERKYRCVMCDKSYKFKQQLNLHVLTHSGIKPFSCETCQKCFTLERQLQSHLKVHTSIKPFVCALCGKCFKIKQQLQNHELTHYDIKPFICEICTKAFKLKQQLQNHQKVHEDVKPFPCTRCGKAFKFKQQLQNHNKIHDGIKQFRCEFCDKEFMFKQQLQIHMKIHFGIKEFPCHLCSKDFRTKQQLQKHLEMHERKLLRLSDKSDDGMSEISTLSAAENEIEVTTENSINENSCSIEFPEFLSTKDIAEEQLLVLKRASEVARQSLLEAASLSLKSEEEEEKQQQFENPVSVIVETVESLENMDHDSNLGDGNSYLEEECEDSIFTEGEEEINS